KDQLYRITKTLAIGPFGLRTGGLASDEPCILDAMLQAVFYDGVVPVNDGWEAVIAPHQTAGVAFLGSLQDKAQPGIIALVLHTIQAAPCTFEAHLLGLPHAHAIDSVIGAAGQ